MTPMPRIAVIGCGQWGQNHIRTLADIGALAAVADIDRERADTFAARHGVPALSADDAIAAPHIDALVLALPASLHGPMARRAFAAGKDVLIEKPIALDAVDAQASADAARSAGRLLMVGHVLRFHPVFVRLAELVAEGRIGRLRHVVSNRLGLGRFLGMDAIWDLAPHDVSLVLNIVGQKPDTIETLAQSVLSDAIDVADIRLGFDDGVSAEIHVSRISPYRDRRFTAIGSEGMITFDDLAPEGQKLAVQANRVWRDGAGFAFTGADPEYVATEPGLPLDRELRHFIACIRSRDEPATGAAEAVETVRILAAASPR